MKRYSLLCYGVSKMKHKPLAFTSSLLYNVNCAKVTLEISKLNALCADYVRSLARKWPSSKHEIIGRGHSISLSIHFLTFVYFLR